jgi:ATP-binding cassette, subfamily B, bacterial
MNTPTDRPKSSKGLKTLAGLMPFLMPYRTRIILAVVALVVAASTTLTLPYGFRNLIDLGFTTAGSAQAENVNIYFIALFLLACLLALATAARFYMVSWLGERVTSDIRSAVYAHVLRQSPAFFEITQTGEVLSRLTTDTTLIQTVVGTSISMALRNILLLMGGVLMMFITSPKLSAIIIVMLVLVILPVMVFGRRVRKVVTRVARSHCRCLGHCR